MLMWPAIVGPSAEKNTLTIEFENIKFEEGVLLLGFYKDAESFRKRKPSFERIIPKSELKNGKIRVSFDDLTPNTYGIAVLDDANNNNKVDFGLVFPLEGFGFSDYYHSSFLPPKFEDFDFPFPEDNFVKVKMRYLD